MPDSLTAQRGDGRLDYLWAAAAAGFVFCLAHHEVFSHPLLLNDDVRQQIYWMEAWRTPGLFLGDWLTDYARHYVSFGVRGVYWLAAHCISPLRFSQILPGFLYIFLAVCIHGCGRRLKGRTTAWAASAVMWLMPGFLYNISGGLARAFAAPLLALFLWGWLAKSARMTAAALLLAALFIPYISVLCGATLGLAWVFWRLRLAPAPPLLTRRVHFLALFGAAALTILFSLEMAQSGYGPLVSAAEMSGKPEFGVLGRYQMLPVPSIWYELIYRPLERLLPFRELGIWAGIVVALFCAYAVLRGARRVAWRKLTGSLQGVLWLCGASIVLYAAARFFLLKLFVPSRYLEYSTILVYSLLLGLCLTPLLRGLGRNTRIGLLVCCALLGGLRLHNEALYDYSQDLPLYQAIRATPKSALFAGHPYTMDNVLAFGQRAVFSSYELTHPWSRGLWKKLNPRLSELFDAYYAHDADTVRRFAKKYKIDYFVVDTRQFSPDYLLPSPRLVPFYEAAQLPGWLQLLCRKLGLQSKVPVRFGCKTPRNHPYFAPFAESIAAAAATGKKFALLQPNVFPSREIGPYYRILHVRR